MGCRAPASRDGERHAAVVQQPGWERAASARRRAGIASSVRRYSPPPERITCTPLLHLFVDYAHEQALQAGDWRTADNGEPHSDPSAFALFFGRLEKYKGVEVMMAALRLLAERDQPVRAILAGQGQLEQVQSAPLPATIQIRNRVIEDDEAIDLFRRCRLVVLPYIDATQSALIGAAYFFGKPVVVTRVGALPEYVVEGQTGWVVEPGDAPALAACLQGMWIEPGRVRAMGQAARTWYEAQRASECDLLSRMYDQLSHPTRL